MITEDVLLPYQKIWIADDSAVKISEKSRRIGLTWAEACDDVLNAAAQNGRDVYYMSYNLDAAKEFVETCGDWARDLNKVASDIQEDIIRDDDKDILVYKITFASGHKIVGMPSKPSVLRGKQGIVVLDEAAFCEDLAELLKAAMALLMWGGAVRIISTHNGEDNPFNELIKECRAGKKSYSVHRTTIEDALKDGLYKRICLRLGQPWSKQKEAGWLQDLVNAYGEGASEELYCIPARGGAKYFPRALVERCMDRAIPVVHLECKPDFLQESEEYRDRFIASWAEDNLLQLLERAPDRPSFVGQDFARSGDLTVTAIGTEGEVDKEKIDMLCYLEMRNVPFRAQYWIDKYIIDHLPRWYGASLDARGNGQQLAEDLALHYGSAYIHQVMITKQFYLEFMPKYKARMEDSEIALPYSYDIIDDHRLVVMDKGIPRIPDERTSDKNHKKRHGDSVVSGLMIEHAVSCEDDYQPYEYEPASPESAFATGVDDDEDW